MSDKQKIDKAMKLSVELWNTFVSIEQKHSMDEQEMCRDVHDIQNRLFAIAHKLNHKIPDQR